MEPEEMQKFAAEMKEDGEAVARELHSVAESATTRIALAISVLAMLVAMVTVLGHRTHTEAVLLQSRANDAWSEYQSKKIRADLDSVAIDLLTLQPNSNAAAVAAKIASDNAHLAKETSDLAELQHTARDLESEVRHAEAQASRYDLGEALLQIAVVLSSITLLTRRNGYFYLGLALGVAGLLTAASALLLH